MTLSDLTRELDSLGVHLDVRLRVDAPTGAITPELLEALEAHRPLLLHRLVREMVWADLSTRRWAGADESPGIDNPGRRPSLETLAAALAQGVGA